MMKTLLPVPLILAACAGPAWADATLTYALTGTDGARTTKTLAVSRFFVRIDDSASKDTYLLYQAGKFFPLYEVNPTAGSYTRLTPEVKATLGPASRSAGTAKAGAGQPVDSPVPAGGKAAVETAGAGITETATSAGEHPEEEVPVVDAAEKGKDAESQARAEASAAEGGETEAQKSGEGPEDQRAGTSDAAATPAAPLPLKPEFRATRAKREVAGIECRVVEELRDGKPVIEHCMANKARLGITEREARTLARTLVMARKRDLGWLGAATEDEEFVSIEARDLESGGRLELQSVSTAPLPQGHLRIPREYRQTNR